MVNWSAPACAAVCWCTTRDTNQRLTFRSRRYRAVIGCLATMNDVVLRVMGSWQVKFLDKVVGCFRHETCFLDKTGQSGQERLSIAGLQFGTTVVTEPGLHLGQAVQQE